MIALGGLALGPLMLVVLPVLGATLPVLALTLFGFA